jgi:uncharacterized protein (DUF2237 family)
MNVFGKKLKMCVLKPVTGYKRNGYCNLDKSDEGTHIVCAVVTKDFLNFTFTPLHI